MRIFAQKPKATQQTTSSKSTMPSRSHFGQSREVNSILQLQRTLGNQAVQQLLEGNTRNVKGDSTTEIARLGHDFSRIPVHASARSNIQPKLKVTAPADRYEQKKGTPVHDAVETVVAPSVQGILSSSRQPHFANALVESFVNPPRPRLPSPLAGTTGQRAAYPSSIELERTVNMTPGGLAKGYRTAYGILSVMHLLPDTTNWASAQVFEVVSLRSSTCPASWNLCSGTNQPFPIGQQRYSTILGTLPAERNRIYDFHTSRWNRSRLHDAGENPTGMDSCEVSCNQSYVCGNRLLGSFVVTRRFRKGRYGGRDVTIVDTTKRSTVSQPGDFPLPRRDVVVA